MKKIQDIRILSKKSKKKIEPLNPQIPSFPVKIPDKKKKKTSLSNMDFGFLSYTKFSVKKKTFFAKRLSFLIRSGVPMLESMHVIKAQAKGRAETRVFEKVISDVANGQTLSNSLKKFRSAFGDFTINVVRAGEASGTLMHNLDYLADELKKRSVLRRKIKSALIYPAIITVATLGIVGFLTIYIFPKIMPIFQSMSVDLPFSTKVIMAFSNLMRESGLIVILGLVLVVVGFSLLKKFVPAVRRFYDGFLLRIPIFGPIVKNYNLTNLTRTTGILLKSGMSLTESLTITAETNSNTRYVEAFLDASKEVTKGKNVSDGIKKYSKLFPAMTTHMIAIGEKSGNLSSTFIYLSEFYEHEFDEQTKNLSSTIEPVLMVIMGLLVGFVAISVITPIYELTSNISK